MTSNALIPIGPPRRIDPPDLLDAERLEQLASELRHAWDRTDATRLRGFGVNVAGDLGRSLSRRVVKVGRLVATVTRGVVGESGAAFAAARDGRLRLHANERRAAVVESAHELRTRARTSARAVRQAFADDPRESAIQMAVFTLAAVAGSDSLGGHELAASPHASLVTHSIFMGAALETLCLATVRLIDVIHAGLPEQRDPVWDRVHRRAAPIARTASQGLSAGVAWHLFSDGVADVDSATSGGSLDAWRLWLLGNAKVEAFDILHKPRAGAVDADTVRSPAPG